MSSCKLTPTSYLVLGMITLRGPSSSYDLKRAVRRSVGYFWHFPHAQLYSEPRRLVDAGLLSVESEHSGRRRKIYSITEAGTAALRAWLAEPTDEHFQIRYIAELKLFFNEASESSDVIELAEQQIEQHTRRLSEYKSIQERESDLPEVAPRLLTLQLGMQIESAALRFWQALLAELRADGAERAAADCLPGLRRRLDEFLA